MSAVTYVGSYHTSILGQFRRLLNGFCGNAPRLSIVALPGSPVARLRIVEARVVPCGSPRGRRRRRRRRVRPPGPRRPAYRPRPCLIRSRKSWRQDRRRGRRVSARRDPRDDRSRLSRPGIAVRRGPVQSVPAPDSAAPARRLRLSPRPRSRSRACRTVASLIGPGRKMSAACARTVLGRGGAADSVGLPGVDSQCRVRIARRHDDPASRIRSAARARFSPVGSSTSVLVRRVELMSQTVAVVPWPLGFI